MNIELKVLKDAPPSLPASGPFVVELGDQTAVGIAAHEVAAILESERHAHARVFRIHRAYPDGRMELVGVARERFNLEDAFLFWRANERDARQDFDRLRRAAAATPPPCRTRVHLAHVPSAATPDGTQRVINFVITDGTKVSTNFQRTINVVPTDQSPIVTDSGGTTTFVSGDNAPSAPVVVDAGLTLTDSDSATMASATLM